MPTFELDETVVTEVLQIQREIKIPYCHHMNCGKETPIKGSPISRNEYWCTEFCVYFREWQNRCNLVYWRGFFPSNYIKAEFLALVLRGTGEEEEIKKQGKTGFSKNK